MRLPRILIGEFVLLFASVLVFRSTWTLLDQYMGESNLVLLLMVGIVLTAVGLFLVSYEVKHDLDSKKSPTVK